MPQGVPKESETCPVCGDEFLRLQAHYQGLLTCNPPEEDGAETESSTGGYTGYYGVSWETTRQQVLERDGYECQICGLSHDEHQRRNDLFPPNKGLHIHHKTPAKEFDSHDDANRMENLVALCAECHRETENNDLCL